MAIFASGNSAAMLLGVVGSIIQARYVEPEDMGVFRTFGIVAGYLTFLHLGVFDGLQREIPIQLGRENRAEAERAAAACLTWILSVTLICVLIFALLAIKSLWYQDVRQFWGWLAYIPVIIGILYGGYLSTTIRTGQQFVALSKISIVQALAGTIVLPLFPIMGYYAACLRTAASSATNIFFLHKWRAMKIRPTLDWVCFKEIVKMGLPLSGAGYISTALWMSVEGTLVLHWFGLKILGLYAVAVFVRTVIDQLALSVNQVLNVKIYEQYGKTGRVNDCIRLIYMPMGFVVMALIPVVCAAWITLPWIIELLIPKYIEALPMMRLVVVAMPIMFLRVPVTILWAVGRRIHCFISVLIGFASFISLAYLFRAQDMGVLSILLASVFGQALNIIVAYIIIARYVVAEKRISDAIDCVV